MTDLMNHHSVFNSAPTISNTPPLISSIPSPSASTVPVISVPPGISSTLCRTLSAVLDRASCWLGFVLFSTFCVRSHQLQKSSKSISSLPVKTFIAEDSSSSTSALRVTAPRSGEDWARMRRG